MKKKFVVLAVASALILGGCQSFHKDRDIELLLTGAALLYAGGKWLCRNSNYDEHCGVTMASAFVLWY